MIRIFQFLFISSMLQYNNAFIINFEPIFKQSKLSANSLGSYDARC